MSDGSGRANNWLPYSPQDSTWVKQCKVSHTPWTISRRLSIDGIPLKKALGLYVLPPVINVLDEQVHFEILKMFRHKEILQKKR